MRVSDAASRTVRDPHQRDGVGRVVDHLQVRDRVLDLGALVEARAADHLVRDALPDEHVLQHARLRVHPVEDRDLAAREAFLDECGNPCRDEARLCVLVLDLDRLDRFAFTELREEMLRLPLAIVLDDGIRRAEDRVRRAVVLLERDGARAGKVALEVEDVADVGAPEGINGLVRIAHGTKVHVLFGHELKQPVLRMVRVLVLVDEHVAEGLAPALAGFGEAFEDVDGEIEQVVEVDRVRREELALVELVDVGDCLVVER